ncbi:MAG: hypothetical protein N2Z58_05210 [Fervidobacterium sp.]|nr:hypothetical protein [Fervidobacterium sp.]
MKSLKRLLALLLVFLAFTVLFAESEHVHNEECGCEIADSRDLSIDSPSTLPLGIVNIETYKKLKELEENLNLVYDALESRVPYEEFEELRNMVMTLADQITFLDERTSSYIDLVIEGLKNDFSADISNLSDELMQIVGELKVTIDIHDSDILRIYETLGDIPEIRQTLKRIEEELILPIMSSQEQVENQIQDLKISFDIHDSDILKIYETLGILSEQVNLLTEKSKDLEEMKTQLEEVVLKLNLHDQDVVNIYDVLAYKADSTVVEEIERKLEELRSNLNSQIDKNLDTRITLLEEYTNMIYEVANSKVSIEDVEEMIVPIKNEVNTISEKLGEVLEKTKIQDIDIIKLYDAVAKLADELKRIGGRLSLLETIVNELRNK